MRRLRPLAAAALLGGLALAGCSEDGGLQAPTDAGVCWHLVQLKNGSYRFNELAKNQPNLETCAAQLEAMRQRFNNLGARQDEMVGGYQGQFIFIQRTGVFTSRSLTATRYLALVPTGDGRLVIPGAIKQQ